MPIQDDKNGVSSSPALAFEATLSPHEDTDGHDSNGSDTLFFFNGAVHRFRINPEVEFPEAGQASLPTGQQALAMGQGRGLLLNLADVTATVAALPDDVSSTEDPSFPADSSLSLSVPDSAPATAEQILPTLVMTDSVEPPTRSIATGSASGCHGVLSAGTGISRCSSTRTRGWLPSCRCYSVTRLLTEADTASAGTNSRKEKASPDEPISRRSPGSCASLSSRPATAAGASSPLPHAVCPVDSAGWNTENDGGGGVGLARAIRDGLALTPPLLADGSLQTLVTIPHKTDGGSTAGKDNSRKEETKDDSEEEKGLFLLAHRIRCEARLRLHQTTSCPLSVAERGQSTSDAAKASRESNATEAVDRDDLEADFFFAPFVARDVQETEAWLMPGRPLTPL